MSSAITQGPSYDVVIVGAGIAGSAFAYALSTAASTSRAAPLRIALLERSITEPDRIVSEPLQLGGVAALRSLGLGACLEGIEGIDAFPVHDYAVLDGGQTAHIPYPCRAEGRSFHHGHFVPNLRLSAKAAVGIDVLEATVTDLIECPLTRRVSGVRARRTGAEHKEVFSPTSSSSPMAASPIFAAPSWIVTRSRTRGRAQQVSHASDPATWHCRTRKESWYGASIPDRGARHSHPRYTCPSTRRYRRAVSVACIPNPFLLPVEQGGHPPQ